MKILWKITYFLIFIFSPLGVFVKELIKAQTMNPVLILDEIDKISKSR